MEYQQQVFCTCPLCGPCEEDVFRYLKIFFEDVDLVKTVKERSKIGASTGRFIGKETVGDEMIATQR